LSCTRGASAQSLLHSVLAEFDALQFELAEGGMAQMLARVRVEASEAEAREATQKQQRMRAQMQLTCANLRRQLNRRTVLLSHIAVTHQIAVAGLGKDDEDDEALGRGSTITRARGDEIVGSGRSLPLTDIRRNQQKVERRYGSFVLSGRDRCAAATTRRK
jgi:hypothetical protein